MSHKIPLDFLDLANGPRVAALTTVMPDGQPQSTIVWCNSDDHYVLVNSVAGRRKHKNIQRDRRVTLLALDPNDPYRWIEIRGLVEEITDEGSVEHIDELSRLYEGAPGFFGYVAAAERAKTETRIIFKILPQKVHAAGN